MDLSEHLTPEQAVPRLRHNLDTVQRWCRDKALNAVRAGRRFYIHPDEITRFLAHGPAVVTPRKVRTVKARPGQKKPVPSGARKRALQPAKRTSTRFKPSRRPASAV